ncbi:434_t:CDS:2, partial [Acaulospora colombiana]
MPVDPHMKNPKPKLRTWRELARRRGWGYPDILRFEGSVGIFVTQIRNCTRETWVGVTEYNEEDHFEKEKMIRLLLAFSVAVKHHLRLEFGTHWFDLKDLLPEGFQLTYFDGNATQDGGDPNHHENGGLPSVHSTLRKLTSRIPPTTYYYIRNSYSPDESRIWFGEDDWGGDIDASMSLPLEIVFHLDLYFNERLREGKLDGSHF